MLNEFFELGAIVSTKQDEVLVGWGERQWMDDPKEGKGPCFFFPDFFLCSSTPWMSHTHWKRLKIEEFIHSMKEQPYKPSLVWTAPDRSLFLDQWKDLQKRFQSNALKKAVPFAFAHAKESMNPELLKYAMANALEYAQKNPVFLYGFWGEGEGILGATPEILFQLEGNLLKTMAIAGTWPSDQNEEVFFSDSKERTEHQYVIDGMIDSLASFGEIDVGSTEILRLKTLSHLKTPIAVRLKTQSDFSKMIKSLHPTPALGAFPKEEGQKWLLQWQKLIDRKRYGAPAGYLYNQNASCFVAIRNLQWEKKKISIGAGCGVIKESRLEKEWGEILLKIDSIKRIFGLSRISYKILDEDGQGVTADLLTMGREHCPRDKARPIEDKDGVTDCSDSPKVCEKCGL